MSLDQVQQAVNKKEEAYSHDSIAAGETSSQEKRTRQEIEMEAGHLGCERD